MLTISNATLPTAPFTAILSLHVRVADPAAIASLAVSVNTLTDVAFVAKFVLDTPLIVKVHVIDVSVNDVDKIFEDVNIISNELKDYDDELHKKDKWYVFNKIDLLSSKQLEILKRSINAKINNNIFFVSAKDSSGLKKLCNDIIEYLREKI